MPYAATSPDATAALARRARDLDAADPLRTFRDRFVATEGDLVSYLDGNSLGRPPRTTPERLDRFVREAWGTRLIRGWDEGWMTLGRTIGDRLGRVVLGAGPGQVVVADSTTVMLYKLARAAVAARGGRADRREIVLDTDNFPTDRYVLEGIAAERGLDLRWIETDPVAGVTGDDVAAAVGPATALVVLSHVSYRTAHVADAAHITAIAHEAGALALWDVSHSAGSVEIALDAWGADLAAGCTYKYLNGGPGSPAFGYVRAEHQDVLQQPIWGWLGRRDPFAMDPGYEPAPGLTSVVSGTPPVLGMLPLTTSLDLIEDAGIGAIRAKSLAMTAYALDVVDALLGPLGARVVSPRDPCRRGGHVTVRHPAFRDLMGPLWERGVLADYREPECIRIGLSPLSTSFAETHAGLAVLAGLLEEATR